VASLAATIIQLEPSSLNKPTLLLVHGAWHDGGCWALVTPLLEAAGYRVLAPDLPGHGNNHLPLAKVTLKAYTTSLLQQIDAINGAVVLVGHSMAGMVISEVAASRPDRIAQLIYLCAYLPRHDESLFELIALNRGHEPFTPVELAMQMSDDKRSCRINDEDIIPLFYTLTPSPLAQQARAHFGVQATLPLAAKVNLQAPGFQNIPRTYICCTGDLVIPLHHQRRMLSRQPCGTLLQIEADHSPFLSRPVELAALLAACAGSK